MKQHQCIIQNTPQHAQGGMLPVLSFFSVQRRFNGFKVSVTEFMPYKIVKRSCRIIKPVTIQRFENFTAHPI